ncbi:DgyrCDS11164 [Dimorphilus gyrociliatus]|uniref:DgyrCDS11164 n=1 Tax=Dimorphilus gyrociliatus TaxID=2664684 RepID=A0A7I8W3I0_9ANNE|nr:DgyrCDS11164 [Dimorphilus gyrociliatus]
MSRSLNSPTGTFTGILTPEMQLARILRDIEDCIEKLKEEFQYDHFPLNDDKVSVQKFCAKIELLLQVGLKDKRSVLGNKKDYWDYICQCISGQDHLADAVRLVKRISEIKTSKGRGRALIRFCLVHQRLADTLQHCVLSIEVTRLYDLNDIQFDLPCQGYDLDISWPSFSRKVLPITVTSPPSMRNSISMQSSIDGASQHSSSPTQSECSQLDESILDSFAIKLDLQVKLENLEMEKADLARKLKNAEEDNIRIEGKCNEYALRLESTKSEMLIKEKSWSEKENELRARLQTSEDKAESLQDKIKDLSEGLSAAMSQYASGSTELLNQLKVQFNESSKNEINENQNLSFKIDALEKSVNEKNALQDRVDILVVQLAEMKDNLRTCEKELLYKENLIEELQSQVGSKSEKVLMSELDDLKLQLLQKETKLLENERQMLEYEKLNDDLKRENSSHSRENTEIESTTKKLESEVEILNLQNEELMDSIKKLDLALSEQIKAKEDLISMKDEITRETLGKDKLIKDLELRIENLSKIESLELRFEELQSENNQLTKDLTEKELTNSQLQQSLHDIKRDLTEQIDELRSTSETENQQAQFSLSELDHLKSEILDKKKLSETTEKENADLKEKVEQLKEKLEESLLNTLITNNTLTPGQKMANESNKKLENICETLEQKISALNFQVSTQQLETERNLQTVTESKTALHLMKQKYNNQEELIESQQSELESIGQQLTKEQEERTKVEIKLKEDRKTLTDECKLLKRELAKTCDRLEEESKTFYEYKKQKQQKEEELQEELKLARESLEILEADHNLLKDSLVKMIRDKADLWAENNALKTRESCRSISGWVDDSEATECYSCKTSFSLTFRRHHCRICLRIFCKNCANNLISSPDNCNNKIRVCDLCFSLQKEIDTSNLLQNHIPEESNFDVISEEEVRESLDESREVDKYGGRVINKNDIINGKAAFHERTISPKQVVNFPILIDSGGVSLSWSFKTKPKNITFGITYYKSADMTESGDEEILLQLDSVPSHKDNVNGSIEAHEPGVYVLIFDNTISKFLDHIL